MLDSLAPLIQFERTFDPSRFSADQVAEIKAGIADAANAMAQSHRNSLVRNGWSFPRFSLGDFGEDYDYRAAVALGGLAALPRVEAMYLRSGGADGLMAENFAASVWPSMKTRGQRLPRGRRYVVERDRVVAVPAEHIDFGGVDERRLVPLNGYRSAVDENLSRRVAVDRDGVVAVVSSY
jgi:hypothetical protein